MSNFRHIKAKPRKPPATVISTKAEKSTASIVQRVKAWFYRNFSLYVIQRVEHPKNGNRDERYYCTDPPLPWIFNRRLGTRIIGFSARLQVWVLNRNSTKFEFNAVKRNQK